MKHSEFTDKFHWLNGLSEYYRFTGQEEKFEPIYKALYHNNYYRKRDIIMNFIEDNYPDVKQNVPYELRRAWINMLLHEHFDDVEVKPQLITSMVASLTGDKFVDRIARFIDYFIFNDETETLLPDLGDFLSRGQVKSKLWLVTELAKVVEGPIGNVVFYGGWYNFNAHFLFDMFDVNKIYSIDMDSNVVDPCNELYRYEKEQEKFKAVTANVNKDVTWQGKKMSVYDKVANKNITEQINVVINTSCEHMDNTWFDNLPKDTFVILHQNDYFDNPQHSNCCKDIEDVKSKYPMQNIFYEGELDTHLYNRFMLIGIK